jgi:hypothetical protein
MRSYLTATAAALSLTIVPAVFLTASAPYGITLTDCMQRDGGPSGCSGPWQQDQPGYYGGSFASQGGYFYGNGAYYPSGAGLVNR